MNNGRPVLGWTLALALLATAAPADATLGQPTSSIESDRAALRASSDTSLVHPSYSVQELKVGSTSIREFVSPGGVVFGIAWNGLSHPDLTQLLGPYAAEYTTARAKTRGYAGRRHRRIETDHLVVETWGHMRALQGRAYVPALMPPGVTVDDIS